MNNLELKEGYTTEYRAIERELNDLSDRISEMRTRKLVLWDRLNALKEVLQALEVLEKVQEVLN